jgi:hypothetical protein
MFGKRALEKALSVALSQVSDLRQEVRDLREENRMLLDRILVLTKPGAYREVTLPSLPKQSTPPPPQDSTRTKRFPRDTLVSPKRPPTPPTVRVPSPIEPKEAS